MIQKDEITISLAPGTVSDEVVLTATLHLESNCVCKASDSDRIAREGERLRTNLICSVTGGIAERIGLAIHDIRRIQCLFEKDKHQTQAIDSLVKLCSELRGS